jgi:predicted dehydrogenase
LPVKPEPRAGTLTTQTMPKTILFKNATPLRIGIVGTGGMARQRASAFQTLPEVRLAGIYSPSETRRQSFSREVGVKAIRTFTEILQAVDAIVLCVPNSLHADLTGQALAAGKHVLVEYPLCLENEKADTLVSAARAANRVLMVGNTIIHESPFQYIEAHLGPLGSLVSATSCVALYDTGLASTWYMDPTRSGSCFTAYHYHHIEYYRRLLGEIVWIHARNESQPDPACRNSLSVAGGTLLMGHAGGATSVIQWYLSASGQGLVRDMRINGVDASLSISSDDDDVSHISWRGGERRDPEQFRNQWGVQKSSEDFVAAIAGRMDHMKRLDGDLNTLRAGIAASESSRIGKPVSGLSAPWSGENRPG